MPEPTIPTVVSGEQAQHSHWNTMVEKVQDLVIGHRHDGVGSYGPLSAFSAAAFTNISANALFVASTVSFYGPMSVSGTLGAKTFTADTAAIAGNTSVMGNLTVASSITPDTYAAPTNLSASGIVTKIVAGDNVTISTAAGVGVVAIGVGGTAVGAGTNISFGTTVLGSSLVRETFQVSKQTTLQNLVVDNVSNAGSLFVQSRLYANDGVFTANVSAGSLNLIGGMQVSGVTILSGGVATANVSSDLGMLGSASIATLLVKSTGTIRTLQVSSQATFAGVLADTFSTGGSVYAASRVQAFDVNIANNVSAGSAFIVSSLTVGGPVNFSQGFGIGNISTDTLILGSAQVGYLTLQSGLTYQNVNTSEGPLRIFNWSEGRTYLTVNLQNASGIPDVSGQVGLAQYWENVGVDSSQFAWQFVPSSGIINTIFYLHSGGAVLIGNLSVSGTLETQSRTKVAKLIVNQNISAGSLVTDSATIAGLSAGMAYIQSATVNQLTLRSSMTFLNTNTSATYYRLFNISAGKVYTTLNAPTTTATTPDVSGKPGILEIWDVVAPAGITWQYMTSAGGGLQTLAFLSSAGFRVTLNVSAGSLVAGSAQFTNVSTDRLTAGSSQIAQVLLTSRIVILNQSTNSSAGNFRIFTDSTGRTYQTLNATNESAVPDVSGNPMLIQYMDNLSAAPGYIWKYAQTSAQLRTIFQVNTAGITVGNISNLGTISLYGGRTVTGSTNTSSNDFIIVVNTSSVSMAVTLGAAASSLGQLVSVYHQSGAGTCTTYVQSTDQINFLAGSSDTVTVELTRKYYAFNQSTWLIWT